MGTEILWIGELLSGLESEGTGGFLWWNTLSENSDGSLNLKLNVSGEAEQVFTSGTRLAEMMVRDIGTGLDLAAFTKEIFCQLMQDGETFF